MCTPEDEVEQILNFTFKNKKVPLNSNKKLTLTLAIPLLQLANEVSLIVSVIRSPMVITENLAQNHKNLKRCTYLLMYYDLIQTSDDISNIKLYLTIFNP